MARVIDPLSDDTFDLKSDAEQYLPVGDNFVWFSHTITYTSPFSGSKPIESEINIQTEFTKLDSDSSIINIDAVEFSFSGKNDIDNKISIGFLKKVSVGDFNQPQALRVSFRLLLSSSEIKSLRISGIIIGNFESQRLKDTSFSQL